MSDTETQQKVADLMRACQSVLDSLDEAQMSYAVDNKTQYQVNAHAVWDMGTALAALQEDVKILYSVKESDRA